MVSACVAWSWAVYVSPSYHVVHCCVVRPKHEGVVNVMGTHAPLALALHPIRASETPVATIEVERGHAEHGVQVLCQFAALSLKVSGGHGLHCPGE